jgi:hypothetical protein
MKGYKKYAQHKLIYPPPFNQPSKMQFLKPITRQNPYIKADKLVDK